MIDRMTGDGQKAPHRPARTVGPVPVRDKEVLFAERSVVHAVPDLVNARAAFASQVP
jgi:hypothetical protein